jgi:SAM-dependent methyltransferase
MSSDPWHDWINAAVYADFVRGHDLYPALNRELVRLADLESCQRILDLACGTGATARACLEVLPRDAGLEGVDSSRAMVEMARNEIRDPRAVFHVAPAARLVSALAGRFDRAVCNAALWQLQPLRRVLLELRSVLAPGARFVFNLPAERVVGERPPVHGVQAALARGIEEHTAHPFEPSGRSLDPCVLSNLLTESGLPLEATHRYVHRTTEGELLELMRIPAMIGRLAPDLDLPSRRALLEQVEKRIHAGAAVEVPWLYFVAVATG